MRFKNLRDEYLDISWGFVEILGFTSFLEMIIVDFLIMMLAGFCFNLFFNKAALLYISILVFIIIFYYNLRIGELEDF